MLSLSPLTALEPHNPLPSHPDTFQSKKPECQGFESEGFCFLVFLLEQKPENETGNRAEEKGVGWLGREGKEKLQPRAAEDLVKVLPSEEGCFSKHFSQKDPCLFYKQILREFYMDRQNLEHACHFLL